MAKKPIEPICKNCALARWVRNEKTGRITTFAAHRCGIDKDRLRRKVAALLPQSLSYAIAHINDAIASNPMHIWSRPSDQRLCARFVAIRKTTKTLPPDPEDMNDRRAEWAEEAILNFMGTTGTDKEDALADLLCDLRHWADRNGEDFEAELARANRHYSEETEKIDG